MKKVIIIILFLALASGFGYAVTRARVYREQAFTADSLAAAQDTARLLQLASLNDSIHAYQLRIIQTETERDAIDRELDQTTVALARAKLRVDTIRMIDTVNVPAEINDTTKAYEFAGADGPFAFDGDAQIFYPSWRGVFDVRVNLMRPVPVEARITCGNEPGVRSASLLLTAEDPFSLIPESVTQDPDVCNAPPGRHFSWLPELSWKGIGWELLKGAGWMLLANQFDDEFHKARY